MAKRDGSKKQGEGESAKEPAFEFHADIPSNCPPSRVRSVGGLKIYRLAKKETLSPRDLQVHYERDPERHRGACNAFGYSCFLSVEDIVAFSKCLPALGQYVYQCEAESEYGKIQHTPTDKSKGHYTFWVDQRVDRSKLFRLLGHVDKL